MNLLFVCSQNRLRSPTAERVFSDRYYTARGYNALSAGLNSDAVCVVDDALLKWADYILLMEQHHKKKLRKRFRPFLENKEVVVLGIQDSYEFMDSELVEILKSKVSEFID